jgi:hypothetical protein
MIGSIPLETTMTGMPYIHQTCQTTHQVNFSVAQSQHTPDESEKEGRPSCGGLTLDLHHS